MMAGLNVVPDCERSSTNGRKETCYVFGIVRSNEQIVNELRTAPWTWKDAAIVVAFDTNGAFFFAQVFQEYEGQAPRNCPVSVFFKEVPSTS